MIQARAFFPTTGTAGNRPQKGRDKEGNTDPPLSCLCSELHGKTQELSRLLAEAETLQNEDTAKEPADAAAQLARHYCDQVVPMMESIRLTIDELEQNTASDFWPFPTYGELLFA